MNKLSVIIITLNEEDNIRDCIDSVSFADEVIVVDSCSTDRTITIATEMNSKVISVNNKSYGEAKNIGFENAKSDWLMWLDADERITSDLQNEIIQTINNSEYNVYEINRKSYFLNKFIKHCGWFPDYKIRLFKKDTHLRFTSNKVHEKILFDGKTKKLLNPILHYTDNSIEHYLNKMNRYTTLSALDLKEQKKSVTILDIIFRPVFTFFKMYFLKLGILDGFTGLILCALSSIHVFIKYLKYYYLIKS